MWKVVKSVKSSFRHRGEKSCTSVNTALRGTNPQFHAKHQECYFSADLCKTSRMLLFCQVTHVRAGQVTHVRAGQVTHMQHGQVTHMQHGQVTHVRAGQVTHVRAGQVTHVEQGQVTHVEQSQVTHVRTSPGYPR